VHGIAFLDFVPAKRRQAIQIVAIFLLLKYKPESQPRNVKL
jgi:hypothetical protein